MLGIIGLALALLVAGVLVYASTRPDRFRIERTAQIDAPPEKVFPLVDDFRQWTQWSPWEGIDPDLKRVHAGSARGVGAVYEWEGNRNVGRGRMEIVESASAARIAIKLDFLKPFEAHNMAEFTFERRAEATQLTWAMHGPSPFMSKLMGLVVNMDRMVGAQFELGLARLKAVCEKK